MAFGVGRSNLLPLGPGDLRFQEGPGTTVEMLADRVVRGLCPLLLAGHRGVGKSTLLHALRARFEAVGTFCLFEDLGARTGVDPQRILYDIAVDAVQAWVNGGPESQPSPFLVQDLRASDPSFPQGQGRTLTPLEIAIAAFDELCGAAGMRVPLLVDGLDRLDPDTARAVIRQILLLADRVDLVLIVDPKLAIGVDNVDVLDACRVVPLSACQVRVRAERAFLERVLDAHVQGLKKPVVKKVVDASGGVLADLVGIAYDALSYAEGAVDARAVDSACRDRTERLRRLLLDGDRAAVMAADGSSGAEVSADRKVRLLQHGLLIEYGTGAEVTTCVHPLLKPLMQRD